MYQINGMGGLPADVAQDAQDIADNLPDGLDPLDAEIQIIDALPEGDDETFAEYGMVTVLSF